MKQSNELELETTPRGVSNIDNPEAVAEKRKLLEAEYTHYFTSKMPSEHPYKLQIYNAIPPLSKSQKKKKHRRIPCPYCDRCHENDCDLQYDDNTKLHEILEASRLGGKFRLVVKFKKSDKTKLEIVTAV